MRAILRGAVVAIVPLAVVLAVKLDAADRKIAAAPAFSAHDLTQLPQRNWITNGGNVLNQRYSPLTLLNRDNVKDLKALWRTSMGSGALPNNSGQAQILHYEGTLYVINGANDVFALDVDSGAILWTYHGNPDPKAGVPMGRSSRGVAIGEGKVFVAQLDARLVALDQKTGKVAWSIAAEPWAEGLQPHERAALLQRARDRRLLGRRDGEPRQGEGVSREGRQGSVDVQHRAGPGRAWARELAAGRERVGVRRRAGVADAGGRSRARARLLLDRQSGARSARRRAARQQPVQRVDRRDRREDRQVPLALPAGASRHLGLRLAESRRAVRRARSAARCAKGSSKCRRRAGRTSSTARRASR